MYNIEKATKLKGITNCRYDLNGNLFFTTVDDEQYTLTARDALEIAYTLFDSVGHSYKELEEIDDELI